MSKKLRHEELPQVKTTCFRHSLQTEDLAQPFSHLYIGFFQETSYLAIADLHTDWLSVFRLNKNNSATIIQILRWYVDRLGAAKEITSEGGKAFCSEAMETFLQHRGVTHNIP